MAFPRLLIVLILLSLAGCNLVGGAAAILMKERDEPASYTDLKGQSIAVMIWADDTVSRDYPTIRQDVASAVQSILSNTKVEELKGSRFIDPRSVTQWQDRHPDLNGMALQDIAPKLHVSRVIFIEVQSVETRAPMSPDLFKGTILATMKVARVDNVGSTTQPAVARIDFEEQNIRTIYPKLSPEGVLDANPEQFYHGTVKQFAEQVSLRFFPHPKEAVQ